MVQNQHWDWIPGLRLKKSTNHWQYQPNLILIILIYYFCDAKPTLGLNTRLEIEYQTCLLMSFLLVKHKLGIEFHTPDSILQAKFTQLLNIVLSKKRITKALNRLPRCAGWSAPVFFATPRRQVFSRRCPFNVSVDIFVWSVIRLAPF